MSTATLNVLTSNVPGSQEEADILAVLETLTESNHDKNAALFAAQFTADAAVYNLAPPLEHQGIDLKEKQAWFDSWATPVEIEPSNFILTVGGDIAFAHGFLHMSGTKKGAATQANFWMRETICLERQGSEWKIVHEHTSVPFYMDASLRPAFDLQP
ncbi:MAG: YybH family protein [Terracidiphilus sp.]